MSGELNRMVHRAAAAAVLVVLLTGVPRAGRAGSLGWFGNDARSAAMGGSGLAQGGGPGALLLNPALLSYRPGGFWLGYSVAPNLLHIDLDPSQPEYEVPAEIYDTSSTGWSLDRPVPTSLLSKKRRSTRDLPPEMLLSVVAVETFFHEDLRVGIGLTVPLPGMVALDAWYNDEREQHFSNRLHFERFGEFDSAISIYPAVSFAPLEWISLGVALKVDLALVLDAQMFLTEGTEWEYSYINTGGRVEPAWRPIAGLSFCTPIGLDFGIVYQHYSYFDTRVDIDLGVWNGERPLPDSDELQATFEQSHRFVFGYEPREVALAAAWSRGPLVIEASGAWQQWSLYLDRHGNHWTHPGREPGEKWKDPDFRDVFTVRGGVEWWPVEWAAVRAGAGFFPSPMPSQTGRYNYVDNDISLYSLGAGFRWQAWSRWFTADLGAQLWHMHSMQVHKSNTNPRRGGLVDEVPDAVTDFDGEPLEEGQGFQTNNPGFPGYSFGGAMLSFSLMLGLEFDAAPVAEISAGEKGSER
ncbi:MAG: hypothetical protein R6V85_02135 [Polyangia bacterium]